MKATAAASLPTADRLRLTALFSLSRLSLGTAHALLLASDRLTARTRLRLLPEASA